MMTINHKGNIVQFTRPCIMGILNVTRHSFYDGGRYTCEAAIKTQTEKLLREGADIIDIGCMATNPMATPISEDEELNALQYTLNILRPYMSKALFSIDTYRSKVAQTAVEQGVGIINDISGGTFDPDMFSTVAQLHVPYILTHTTGLPQEMQQHTDYNDVIGDILCFLSEKLHTLRSMGVNDVIIDPGFGFGKTVQQNYTLLKHLSVFKQLKCPVLAGISRKSMLYKLLNTTPEETLYATVAADTIALMQGADILRVHDVKPALDAVKIVSQIV
ncbi:MAG: dihydropteroate synthase [Bacteroidales bacterium]|nr:dihydropteroate synthase [Bacteroidales bacterium]